MVRNRRSIWVLAASVVAITLVAGPALGDVVARRDPKDTPGRLDIRRIRHGHVGEGAVVHAISTYRRFPSRLLRQGGKQGGAFLLWLTDDPSFEGETNRIVLVRWRDGRLRAPVFDPWTERRIGTARTSRPNPRTVRVVIPKAALGTLAESPGYYWFALSIYWDRGRCHGEGCWDAAPNRRAIRHVIPEEVPPEEPPGETPEVSAAMEAIAGTGWGRRMVSR